MAVVVDDGIDRTAHLGGGSELIEVLANDGLVRHGNVRAAHLQGAQSLNASFDLISANLEAEVSVVVAKLGECSVVHCGRAGVTDRVSHKADKLGVAGNTFGHVGSFPLFRLTRWGQPFLLTSKRSRSPLAIDVSY